MRDIAVRASADPRTVKRWLADEPVRWMVAQRIRDAHADYMSDAASRLAASRPIVRAAQADHE